MRWAIYRVGDGVVIGHSEGETVPALPDGYAAHELADGEIAAGTIVDGALVPSAPVAPDVTVVRRARKAQAEAYLADRLAASCTTSIGVVQCDQEATDNIAAKVVSAIAAKLTNNTTWRQAWRRTDNSWSDALTADQMIAFAQQVEGHVTASKLACWAAVDAIDVAPLAALRAIDITAGYPA